MNEIRTKKKIGLICICFIIAVILIITIRFIVDAIVVNNEMKTAKRAITLENDVHMYSSASESKRYNNFQIGTDLYILKTVEDKNGNEWYKVKVGKKIGYIQSKDVGTYDKTYGKKDLMVDVSKFNMQKNFKNIGEFKAFVIKNNIKFVYIRAGGRGYGKAGNMYYDNCADDYAKACEFLEIPFGYYFLEEAINEQEVDEEVSFIDQYIKNHQYNFNSLPIALDVETHSEPGRADKIWDTRYEYVNSLINKLEKCNHKVILYSNANLVNDYLAKVESKMWLAYYPSIDSVPNYWYSDTKGKGADNENIRSKMIGWQFTENGVKGIIDSNIDLSIVYSKFMLYEDMQDIENDINQDSDKYIISIDNLKELIESCIERIK